MPLPELDLRDNAFWQHPARVLNALRERAPVAQSHDGTKLILRHADVGALLLSDRFVNEGISLLERRGFKPGDALYEYRKLAINSLSGDNHRRVRSLVGRALSAQQVEQVRGVVQRRLPALLEPCLGNEVNALDALTSRLPVQVIGEYLGINETDRFHVDALIREGQAKAFGREVTPAIVARTNTIFVELMAFITGLIEARRLAPSNDALTRLLEAREGSDALSPQEVIVLFLNLFIGATESTASAMATGIVLLAEQPGLLAALRAEPALVEAFVEENLRLFPPNILLANKIAREDTEWCGVPFHRGESVIVPLPSPNRDPRAFDNPDAVDLRRQGPRHFTFSLGAHFCLGQALARLQLQQFFAQLTAAVSNIELLEPRIEWEPFAAITTMKSLRVKLHP